MTNYQKIANTVKWLYQKGRAKHVAFIRRNELVEYDRPSETRFFDAIVRIFDGSDLDQIHLDWLVWDDDTHSEVTRDVLFFGDGHAAISLDGNPITAM